MWTTLAFRFVFDHWITYDITLNGFWSFKISVAFKLLAGKKKWFRHPTKNLTISTSLILFNLLSGTEKININQFTIQVNVIIYTKQKLVLFVNCTKQKIAAAWKIKRVFILSKTGTKRSSCYFWKCWFLEYMQ